MSEAPTDEEIREMAKARVGFRVHAMVYAAVNVLLALIWFLTSGREEPSLSEGRGYYWPIWPHLGWGLGLAFHAFGVYGSGREWQQREEEKLRKKYGR